MGADILPFPFWSTSGSSYKSKRRIHTCSQHAPFWTPLLLFPVFLRYAKIYRPMSDRYYLYVPYTKQWVQAGQISYYEFLTSFSMARTSLLPLQSKQGSLTAGSLARTTTSRANISSPPPQHSSLSINTNAITQDLPYHNSLGIASSASSAAEEAFNAAASRILEQFDPNDPVRIFLENLSRASTLPAPLATQVCPCPSDPSAVLLKEQQSQISSQYVFFNGSSSIYNISIGTTSSSMIDTASTTSQNGMTTSHLCFRCHVCGRRFAGIVEILEHEKKDHRKIIQRSRCYYCHKSFSRRDIRLRHIKKAHRHKATPLLQKNQSVPRATWSTIRIPDTPIRTCVIVYYADPCYLSLCMLCSLICHHIFSLHLHLILLYLLHITAHHVSFHWFQLGDMLYLNDPPAITDHDMYQTIKFLCFEEKKMR